jgi:hypothetical protein
MQPKKPCMSKKEDLLWKLVNSGNLSRDVFGERK